MDELKSDYDCGYQDGILFARERSTFSRKAASANRFYRGKGVITVDDVSDVVKQSGRICHWCGKKNLQGNDLTLEHLKPINEKKYLAIACLSCNCSQVVRRGRKLTAREIIEGNNNRAKKWYFKNSDKARARLREYYHKHYIPHPKVLKTPEELKATVSAYNKKYLQEHKNQINEKRRERSKRLHALMGI